MAFKLKYQESSLLSSQEFEIQAANLNQYTKYLQTVAAKSNYQDLECSMQLPKDKAILEKIKDITEKFKPNLKYIVLVGIGGSNLGTKAIYEAIFGSYDYLDSNRLPKILFLDTVIADNSLKVAKIINSLESPKEFLIITVSKSGTTTETVANIEVLIDQIKNKFPDHYVRQIFITDQGSKMYQIGIEQGIKILEIPSNVGGRYSVFSAVGLCPLYLAGLDVNGLLKGAQEAVEDCTDTKLEKNSALLSAIFTFLYYKKGLNVHNSFYFNPELESIGKWYRQLMGESIGKEKDLQGNVVRRGITPIVSIGSTDLHSMAQLYFGGPKDKATNLIHCLKKNGVKVPKKSEFPGLNGKFANKTMAELMMAILRGVKAAYLKNQLPYLEIEISKISERELGYYLQFRMIEIMYLAQLLNINAFDQPNVEDYKKVTKDILK